MKTNPPPNPPETLLHLQALNQRAKALHAQGHYQEALEICLQATRIQPDIADAWGDAGVNCARLGRWQEAIEYAQTALTRGCKTFGPPDTLAHVYGYLGQWNQSRRYGLQALNMRERQFGGPPVIPPPKPGPMPPPPGPQTREHNIIAFSLFGAECKYCEPAVLNVQEQPHIYPHWVCRFYVDDSVPGDVIGRIRQSGGQIVKMDGPVARWPGPMWRFLALEDPQAHRVLFRDADSVISQREAGAVQQWIASGKRFHIMRDWCSHTELMLAGLWGVVGGSLPPLRQLMERFMSEPLESQHFADQYFLRQYVWPYARASLMQHDSVFGFMDGVPFPDGARPDNFHVGCLETAPWFSAKSTLPEGSAVTWTLYRIEKGDDGQPRQQPVCAYPATVQEGAVKARIPEHYARWLQQGEATMRVTADGPAARGVELTDNSHGVTS